jgi:Arc/MetJ-type ribon-helix-helix transcriptional regulator
MNVVLRPEIEAFIGSKVQDGTFHDADEAANHLMEQQIEQALQAEQKIDAILDERMKEVERGEFVEMNDEYFNSIHQRINNRNV